MSLVNEKVERKELNRKKYCRFKKMGLKYLDYKDPNFLMKFLNEQGKILPRRATGVTVQQQRKLAKAIKRARMLSLFPFVGSSIRPIKLAIVLFPDPDKPVNQITLLRCPSLVSRNSLEII